MNLGRTNLEQLTDARSPAHAPNVPRLPNIRALTSVRFFAALYVAFYHIVRPFSLWGPLAAFAGAGYTGVSFFYLLSGFILTYSHAQEYEAGRPRASKFWVARFARIYPVYLLVLLASVALFHNLLKSRLGWAALGADLLGVQAWSPQLVALFNIPAWSISVEAFFYLVFPFVLLPLRTSSRAKTIAAGLGFWLLGLVLPTVCLILWPVASWSELPKQLIYSGHTPVYVVMRNPLAMLPEFLAGISLGWLYLRFRPSARAGSLMTMAGLLGLALCLPFADRIPFLLLQDGLLLPIFAMLILGLCYDTWFSRLLSHSALVLLGEASFALYLIHLNFDHWVKSIHPLSSLPLACTELAIVIPVSLLLHLYVERPGRRAILQWWKRRHQSEMKLTAL